MLILILLLQISSDNNSATSKLVINYQTSTSTNSINTNATTGSKTNSKLADLYKYSGDPSRIGVPELMIHPVPPNSKQPYILTTPSQPKQRLTQTARFSNSLDSSERLIEPDYLYRGQSGRSASPYIHTIWDYAYQPV